MIRRVYLGGEISITAENKVGLLADIAMMLANNDINIDAVCGYEQNGTAILLLMTPANIVIVGDLRKKGYQAVSEQDVVVVELENKPGALKVVTTELGKHAIDIKSLYVTSSASDSPSRMILRTSDNEKAIALLTKYVASVTS